MFSTVTIRFPPVNTYLKRTEAYALCNDRFFFLEFNSSEFESNRNGEMYVLKFYKFMKVGIADQNFVSKRFIINMGPVVDLRVICATFSSGMLT